MGNSFETTPAIPPSPVTGVVQGSCMVLNNDGTPAADVTFMFQLIDQLDGSPVLGSETPFAAVSSVEGVLVADFIPNAFYVGWQGSTRPLWSLLDPFVVPASGNFVIPAPLQRDSLLI